jgi:hypothetical protein
MTANDIYKKFTEAMPYEATKMEEWHPNGKDSIRLRPVVGDTDFIFTYLEDDTWIFETADAYMARQKGE